MVNLFFGKIKNYIKKIHFISTKNKIENKFYGYFNKSNKNIFFVSTKNGLYQIIKNKIYLVSKGEFFGITKKTNNHLLVFQKCYVDRGRILDFYINQKFEVKKRKTVIDFISCGIHQIRIHKNNLYVMDTYNNSVLEYDINTFRLKNKYFPLGELLNGRKSINYGHLNSIAFFNGRIFIMAHNETAKTKKNSAIFECDSKFNVIKKIETNSKNAHDIFIFRDRLYHCDSMNGSLKEGNKEIVKTELFTRGLFIDRNIILMGGSEYAIRKNRNRAKGKLFLFRNGLKREKLNEYYIDGMVQDIIKYTELK